ncbi:hypothetical protein DFH11DRAFT_1545666 [Phellopilus nigrolimitatus]|nr:hypothetical protein DFH11DRAFT_1545666 [Phellopilus nigrolimitatus]
MHAHEGDWQCARVLAIPHTREGWSPRTRRGSATRTLECTRVSTRCSGAQPHARARGPVLAHMKMGPRDRTPPYTREAASLSHAVARERGDPAVARTRGPPASHAREAQPSHTVARAQGGTAVARRRTRARRPGRRVHRVVRVRAAHDTSAQKAAAAAKARQGGARGQEGGGRKGQECEGLCVGEWHGPGCKNLEGAKGGGARGDVDGGDATATWVVDVARFGLGPAPKSK